MKKPTPLEQNVSKLVKIQCFTLTYYTVMHEISGATQRLLKPYPTTCSMNRYHKTNIELANKWKQKDGAGKTRIAYIFLKKHNKSSPPKPLMLSLL